MVEETAADYAKYINELNFSKEINPICTSIDEILTRLEEFESSLLIIKNTTAATSLPNIAECRPEFQKYFQKIDNLQLVIDRMNNDLTALEQNVTKAEDELGYNDSGLKGFLKTSIFGKATRNDRQRHDYDDSGSQPSYQPVEIFKASDYFGNENEQKENSNS